jgi:Zn finger protein HypA/HybF involved in hydrogenase expression
MTELDNLLFSADENKETTICPECDKSVDVDSIVDDICPLCNRRMTLITMEEYGRRLPIGVLKKVEGQETLLKDFSVEKVNFPMEREISNFWNSYARKRDVSPIDYIAVVVAHAFTSLAGQQLGKFETHKKLNIVHNLFLGDVFYIYAWLRYETLGRDITLNAVNCNSCNKPVENVTIDLGTLEINNVELVEDVYSEFELRDGFEFMNKLCKKLIIKPPTFRSIVGVPDFNTAESMAALAQTSIYKVEDFDPGLMLTDNELKQLGRYDMNILEEEMNYITAGPNWTIQTECPHCNSSVFQVIDWRYVDFFGRSSRSIKRKRSKRTSI